MNKDYEVFHTAGKFRLGYENILAYNDFFFKVLHTRSQEEF